MVEFALIPQVVFKFAALHGFLLPYFEPATRREQDSYHYNIMCDTAFGRYFRHLYDSEI